MEDDQETGFKSRLKKLFSKTSSYNDKNLEKPSSTALATDEEKYNTRNKKIGFALVFNQINIEGLGTRIGSEKDKSSIMNALQSYGFDVKPFTDLKKKEIYNILSEYSTKSHSENDCLVVVVMSHGIRDRIYAADKSYKVEKLWEPFLGDNCESLFNKPKLFFIQSCRGEKIDHGSQFQKDAPDSPTNLDRDFDYSQENESPSGFHIPHVADLLVYYSTFRDYIAWKPKTGSFFIQTLAAVLEESARDNQPKELYSLLTKVNRKVAYEYQSTKPDVKLNAKKQMPCIESTLTKIFSIQPKIEMLQE